MIKAYYLYTGPDGHSHIKTGYIAEGMLAKATSIRFQESPVKTSYDWHTAPTTQFVINLSGTLEFTTFLNETFILNPGEVLVAMDTTGSGHKWRLIDESPWKRAYVLFEVETAVNFVDDQEA